MERKESFVRIIRGLLVVSFMIAVASCQGTGKSDGRIKGSPQHTKVIDVVELEGRLVGTDGPVAGVVVLVNGHKARSDEKGIFRLNVPASQRYILNARKPGYGLLSRVFDGPFSNVKLHLNEGTSVRADPTQAIVVQNVRTSGSCVDPAIKLIDWGQFPTQAVPRTFDSMGAMVPNAFPPELQQAIDLIGAGPICNPGITVRIPANSLVNSANAPPGGKVDVTVATIDLYSPDAMPGDYTVASSTDATFMQSYGAGTIDIWSDGRLLQLKKGAKAEVIIPVDALQSLQITKGNTKAPESIPLLRYDPKTATWRPHGKAFFDKKLNAYRGFITHLSEINMDILKTNPSCVRIDATAISDDFRVYVTVPTSGTAPVVRDRPIGNTSEKIHALYNLPNNTNISIVPYQTTGLTLTPLGNYWINTGGPQSPATPNPPNPATDYAQCQRSLAIADLGVDQSPSLFGPASTSSLQVDLSWTYRWGTLVSSADGYLAQRSTSSTFFGTPTTVFDSLNNNDHDSPKVLQDVVPSAGTYYYRARANSGPWSNVLQVQVADTATPSVLRIVNDLPGPNADWQKWNGLISIRIGPTAASVTSDSTYETLTPYDSVPYNASIPRQVLGTGQSADFDVSGFSGEYWIWMGAGWWDLILDTVTFDPLWWEKTLTVVTDCTNTTQVFKTNLIQVIPPFENPEVINASDYLPSFTTWAGHPMCP
ncbi:MAG: hypothetical protein BMS9Abin05_2613 [Rhodothermia bacterium]|nr:MAG: hypothetical protein BMS9Abin05_2613 [Rhodothermia bacterium]